MKTLSLEEAIQQLQKEMPIAYPTETFYAIGGLALSPKAANAVFASKQRPATQPLPVIIGQIEQLPLLAKNIPDAELALAELFWPGPLSILFKAGAILPKELLCNSPEVAIRQTSHAGAAELCKLAGPLSSSSANLSGEPAVAEPEQLSPKLLENIAGVISLPPQPAGGKASTLVRALEPGLVELIRPGAISPKELQKKGWDLMRPDQLT